LDEVASYLGVSKRVVNHIFECNYEALDAVYEELAITVQRADDEYLDEVSAWYETVDKFAKM
jgi:ABC-type enterochelin transport system substrate-binding protein